MLLRVEALPEAVLADALAQLDHWPLPPKLRAGQLFEQGEVPIIGLVENMAGYACPHCGEVSDPFGQGGVEKFAAALEIPFLGRVPLTLATRIAGDRGEPPAAGAGEEAAPFDAIAEKIARWLDTGRL